MNAGSSSYRDAVFMIVDMIVEILPLFISGICIELSMFWT